MKLDVIRIVEIAARAAAATEGPWTARNGEIGATVPADLSLLEKYQKPRQIDIGGGNWGGEGGGYQMDDVDAEFCAHAREDIPWLLNALAEQAAIITAAIAEANGWAKSTDTDYLAGRTWAAEAILDILDRKESR